MAPACALLLVFVVGPILYSLYLAFTDTRLTGAAAANPQWIGLDNFSRLLESPGLVNAVWLTTVFVVGSAVIGQNVLGLTIALLLRNRSTLVKALVGAVIVSAYVFPEIVPSFMWFSLLSTDGLVNTILAAANLPAQSVLTDQPMVAIILADVWRATAFSMLVYSAALSDIPSDLMEAANLDGAGYVRTLRSITLPLLRPTMFTNLMIITLPTLSLFTTIFVLTGGGPGDQSETMPIFMYRQAFQFGDLAYGTAISMVLLGMGAVITIIYVLTLRPTKVH